MAAKLDLAIALAIAVMGVAACSHDDPTFGQSFDACVLKHGASDTANDICARHFTRPATPGEAMTTRLASSVTVLFDQAPDGFMNKTPWDKIQAEVVNRNDDLVVTNERITATFYKDAEKKIPLSGQPVTWDLDDVVQAKDVENAIGLFTDNKAPSRFFTAYVEPTKVYSHVGK